MKRQVKSNPNHPYIERRRGYRGGRPIIAGTNFPVSSVATYIVRQGMLPEELVRTFPHLTLAQVHDALSYYYDHQAEIDDEMGRNLSEDALTDKYCVSSTTLARASFLSPARVDSLAPAR